MAKILGNFGRKKKCYFTGSQVKCILNIKCIKFYNIEEKIYINKLNKKKSETDICIHKNLIFLLND